MSDDGGSSDDTGGPVDLPTPDFVEPATGEVAIVTTRRNDLVLEVRVDVGVTRLWIDGSPVGTLTSDPRVGSLQSESLALRLRGAMLAGIHTLQLQTPDAVETEASDEVTVTIEAPPDADLSYEPGEPIAEGDGLVVGSGQGGAVLALVIDTGGTSTLRAWPAVGDRWDTERSSDFVLDGHVPRGRDARVAVSPMQGDTVRAAWVAGQPGTSIATSDAVWGEAATAPRLGFRTGPWLAGREWIAIERPLLAGPLVLAEIHAPVDTESPRPGDHVIASVPWADFVDRTPAVVPLTGVDLDLGRVVIDTLAIDASVIGLRRASSEPILLEIDASSGSLALFDSAASPSDARWQGVAGPLVTTRGAFDSRFVAGLDDDGTAIVTARIDDGGKSPPVVSRIALPEGRPATAAIAGTVVDGRVIVLVPRGAGGLVAIEISAPEATPRLLDAACDAVAAVPIVEDAAMDASDDAAGGAAIDVACLTARALSIGRLIVDAP